MAPEDTVVMALVSGPPPAAPPMPIAEELLQRHAQLMVVGYEEEDVLLPEPAAMTQPQPPPHPPPEGRARGKGKGKAAWP